LQDPPRTVKMHDAVIEHFERRWGLPEAEFRSARSPLEEVAPDLSLARYRRESGLYSYSTSGLSAANREVPLELFVVVRPEQALVNEYDWLEALSVIAHFHATGASLDVGHTVSLGRPWLPGSSCEYGLVSLPYLDGPALEWPGDSSFRCLWLLPITAGELEYKRSHGVDALESLLESSGVDVVDAYRPSSV